MRVRYIQRHSPHKMPDNKPKAELEMKTRYRIILICLFVFILSVLFLFGIRNFKGTTRDGNQKRPAMQKNISCLDKKNPAFHDPVDVERWRKEFPLEPERKKAREFVDARKKEDPDFYSSKKAMEDHVKLLSPKAGLITGPYELSVMDTLREEANLEEIGLPVVCADVFVWNFGEPENRSTTKTGGLPYWPKNRPWPTNPDREPLIFLAQFNFKDSTDLVGETPGDILLLFLDPSTDSFSLWPEDKLSFFWQDVEDSPALVKPPDLPKQECGIAPCWGSLFRTHEWGDMYSLDEEVLFEIQELLVYEATKIGGEPLFIQEEPENLPGRHLCTLASLNPGRDEEKPYPFINTERSFEELEADWDKGIGVDTSVETGFAMFGDGGSLYIFMDEKGRLSYEVQCY